tara:strand:- start:2031 stop:2906 length:876 start_codon:yes stop_codon:yes gene_type:complete
MSRNVPPSSPAPALFREPDTAASIAAHAAMFDGVATRYPGGNTGTPKNNSHRTAARGASVSWFDAWLNDHPLENAQALDLGCGHGDISTRLARLGARVTGIDISRTSLARARTLAREQNVSDRVDLQEGNAENLSFDDNRFDFAVSAGVMSFVDFDRAIAELSRVVKPGGTAVILDRLGHHPIARIGRKRRLVTRGTTQFQTDDILTCNHLDRLRAHFAQVDVHVFDLLTVPMILVENALTRVHPALAMLCTPFAAGLRALDRAILKWRPIRRYAFRVVVVLKRPRIHETG